MNIVFRHGPKDGVRRFLPLGRLPATIIVSTDRADHLYRKIGRTIDGDAIYQHVGIVNELVPAA